ncbi:hypothetical protein JOQ06_029543 [Pogonophryne albipinna]|uniref:Uncharacterized protein n=1 Tax=Pogonophryne albipinna TaxID=1090488 RepID=A0AAD6A6L2_9TELE|nr:hypothetical protein JOQ06_029543 [Pogonophryne albipinna]
MDGLEAAMCINLTIIPLHSLVDEYGAGGFSDHGASFRGGPSSGSFDQDQNQDQNQGPAPGIGFSPGGPGSAPSGPPNPNYNNIHIPPGAHAPANTPAELPPASEKSNIKRKSEIVKIK